MHNKQIEIQYPKDGEHIFEFMKRFERKALKSNWTKKELYQVFDKAFCYSYHHTLDTLLDHCLFSKKDLENL